MISTSSLETLDLNTRYLFLIWILDFSMIGRSGLRGAEDIGD